MQKFTAKFWNELSTAKIIARQLKISNMFARVSICFFFRPWAICTLISSTSDAHYMLLITLSCWVKWRSPIILTDQTKRYETLFSTRYNSLTYRRVYHFYLLLYEWEASKEPVGHQLVRVLIVIFGETITKSQ